jgi:hypothetical protein
MEKRKSVPQSYNKNSGIQPGWVSIHVPAEIAACLKEIDFKYDHEIVRTSMMLDPNVRDTIHHITESISRYKKSFEGIMFTYLFGIAHPTGSNTIEEDSVDVLYLWNEFINSITDHISRQSGKDGNHE